MADTTPQQHAEALEKALDLLGSLPREEDATTSRERYERATASQAAMWEFRKAASLVAISSLLDERKRLLDERDELRAQVEALRADAAIAHELRKLAGAQKPMPADIAQILEDNLWDLLITDDAARSQEDKG